MKPPEEKTSKEKGKGSTAIGGRGKSKNSSQPSQSGAAGTIGNMIADFLSQKKVVSTDVSLTDSDDSGSDAEFWSTDLVWPDPENVFGDYGSGIKPINLASRIKKADMQNVPLDLCQKVRQCRRRPKPTSLPWNIHMIYASVPDMDEDDVEEFLVHDSLFVEFFNAFLALPSFPEPICFNVETGGFEVVGDAKQKLARQIKEAVRSQNLTAKMYRVTRQHAYADMPIIPIEESDRQEEIMIDTSYEVTTLNKDQGIYWVKAERLPIFLESDYYFQYRLAKVISQVKVFNENKEFVIMKIDYTPKPKKIKTLVEVPPPKIEDIIQKEMFVSFGDLRGAAKEAWFTEAKDALRTTFTSLAPKVSTGHANTGTTKDIPESKPKSSVFKSHYFGVYSPGLAGPGSENPPIDDEQTLNERLFTPQPEKPFTPRPSDKMCVSTNYLRTLVNKGDPTGDEEMVTPGKVVYQWPSHDIQNIEVESGIGEEDMSEIDVQTKMNEQTIIDEIYKDGTWEEKTEGKIVLKSLDEFGSVIVGAVLKKTIAGLLEKDESMLQHDPRISKIYPNPELACLSVQNLDLCHVVEKEEDKVEAAEEEIKESLTAVPVLEPVHVKWQRNIKKPVEEESDADSLLDSDEDFEERDAHFRRNKDKWNNLTSMKGIMAFKNFLQGTQGEKFWNLWIDIDKIQLIRNEDEKQKYILNMRNRYYKQGSQYELTREDKKRLGLENISAWIPEYLQDIHGKVLEPLVLYWAPRYLIKNLLRTHPEKYYMYNQMKMASSSRPETDPYPYTRELLPLGPKTCCPRTQRSRQLEANANLQYRPKSRKKYKDMQSFTTAPKVGNKRVFGQDTYARLAQTATAKYISVTNPRPGKKDGKVKSQKDLKEIDKESTFSEEAKKSFTSKGNISILDEKDKESGFFSPTGSKHGGSVASLGGKLLSTEKKRTASTGFNKSDQLSKESELAPATSGMDRSITGEALSQVKVPKDLISPMLRIVDTKDTRDKYKRMLSAPQKRGSEEATKRMMFYRLESQESSKPCDPQDPKLPPGQQGNIPIAEMRDCDFMASERMEFLLQALHREDDSGKSFRKFIEKSDNENWLNSLEFWENVQEFRKLFYKDKLDVFLINKTAKGIFAQCVVEGAPKAIGVSDSIELDVMKKLSPAFEDLYDEAEIHALKILFNAFQLYLAQDVETYQKVERLNVTRRLETRNAYILNLQKQGIIKEGPLTPDDPMEGYVDPVYDESLLESLPEHLQGMSIDKLMHNRILLEAFRHYLAQNYAETDLKCWIDMEAWRRTPPDDAKLRDQRARDIKKNYLNRKYFFGPSSPASLEGQNRVMEVGGGWGKFLEDKPCSSSILEAQKLVAMRINLKHLPLFLLSKEYQDVQHDSLARTSECVDDDAQIQRKKRTNQVLKVVNKHAEDRFYRTLKKPKYLPPEDDRDLIDKLLLHPKETEKLPSILVLADGSIAGESQLSSDQTRERLTLPPIDDKKLLESKWISSTKEIYLFQRALQNPITCRQFMDYVSVKGDNLENDVLFWLEVQKYKQMHHNHPDEGMLTQKISAINHCFIDSTIPPSLQIDIPQDMADKILERKHEKSPYLFREAQLAVFRILLSHWQPFTEFRNNISADERVLSTLDRHRIIAKRKEELHREELERQREKERQLRLALGLGDNDELPEDQAEEGEDEEKLRFSYSDYIAESITSIEKQNPCASTQTIRCIPDFKNQPVEERPGFVDDFEVEDAAKFYRMEDILNYREYLGLKPDGTKIKKSKKNKK